MDVMDCPECGCQIILGDRVGTRLEEGEPEGGCDVEKEANPL